MPEDNVTPAPDNTGTAADKGNPDGGQGQGGPGGDANTFLEGLPEDLRGNELLSGLDSSEALAKAFVEAKGQLPVVPESPEGYKEALKELEGLDEDGLTDFLKYAHENKLDPKAVEAAVKFDLARQTAQNQVFEEIKKGQEEKLRAEWPGDKFDQNVEAARSLKDQFAGSKEDKEALDFLFDKTGLGSFAPLVRLMAKIKHAIGEKTAPDGPSGGSEKTAAEVLYGNN